MNLPTLLNTNAVIMCSHGGQVKLIPKDPTVQAGGAPVVSQTDIIGSPIIGCAQVSIATKPCTTVVSAIAGQTMKVNRKGVPLLTQALQGMTDGAPPGTLVVVSPGQMKAQGT